MRIAPIKSEDDYEAALAEIAALMDAEGDTPEGDRLDVLVTPVEAYEARHWTIDPPEPTSRWRVAVRGRSIRPDPGGFAPALSSASRFRVPRPTAGVARPPQQS